MMCSGLVLYISPTGRCDATFRFQEGPLKTDAIDITTASSNDVSIAICLAYLKAFQPGEETTRIIDNITRDEVKKSLVFNDNQLQEQILTELSEGVVLEHYRKEWFYYQPHKKVTEECQVNTNACQKLLDKKFIEYVCANYERNSDFYIISQIGLQFIHNIKTRKEV